VCRVAREIVLAGVEGGEAVVEEGEEKAEEEEEAKEEGVLPGHEKDCECGKCRLIRAYLAMEEGAEVC
jgi:hypothetical protein